ncbi:MAG: dimethylargininase [Nannocystis sp.]|nr:N(G),N(G)-dimethylarginine dimethylaminohydrolase [Nannocystis sp.]MBA3550506.1 dimethylargininase [Nannocystis sp.]
MLVAITREPSASLGRCELSFVAPQPIDVALAFAQHRSYVAALVAAGCEVVSLPAEPELPDAVFVEDTAVVVDELAILTRPGALSRRAEVDSIGVALAPFRRIARLIAPATLDGGDVLWIGRTLYVGRTARTNEAACEQLRGLLGPFGYSVESVPVTGCLHLKSAVTAIADGVLLANRALVDVGRLGGARIIDVDPDEPHAANVLRIGARLIYPSCYPRTRARLADFDVIEVDASEVIKAEGAMTCCSLVFTGQRGGL